MGLDMYLYRKTYIKSWGDEEEFKITLKHKGKNIKLTNPKEISEEVGYWRKANQIHNWFVENVQDGEDNCQPYEVSRRQLKELLNLCLEVKEKAILISGKVVTGMVYEKGESRKQEQDGLIIENAEEIEELLPTTSGFFFGGTEYDEFYMNDINETIEILEKVLNEDSPEGVSQWYEYRSSW